MKITMTVEFEVSDIPEEERCNILDDSGMDETEVPRISDMTESEVASEITDAFDAMFNGADYDCQAEVWAGSNFYGFITGFRVISDPTK